MTSMGEMSAASTTMPAGREEESVEAGGDFRSALTTSFTPRFRDLVAAAGWRDADVRNSKNKRKEEEEVE